MVHVSHDLSSSWKITYQYDDKEEQPDLRICQTFRHLVPSNAAVTNTGLVGTDMPQQVNFLVPRQEPSFHGSIWQQEHVSQPKCRTKSPNNDEHYFPGPEICVLSMLETERNQSSNNLTETDACGPYGKSKCLLRFGVPLAADQEKRWDDSRLRYTQENPCQQESSVVSHARGCSCDGPPQEHVQREPCGRWNLLEETC